MDIKLKNNNKKKIIFLVLTIIMCLGVSLGAVYFIYLYNDERENTLETGLISIAYTEGSESIVLENQVPVIDDIGLTNTPYEFTVQNTSKVPINVKFQIIPENNNQIPLGAVRYGLYINDELMEKDNLGKSDDNTFYILENFEVGATIQAKLVFWVDYYYETPGETFAAKIRVTGESFDIIYEETFVDLIKSKYGTDTTLVAVNTDGDLYDGTGEIREYRYSGPTANNYVFFDTDGDGEKTDDEVWRIIGIFKDTDGNEKIKMMRNTVLETDLIPIDYFVNNITYTLLSGGSIYFNKNDSSSLSNNWATSGLQYYLNTETDETDTNDGATSNVGYLSLLSDNSKALISPTTYSLGNVTTYSSTSPAYYTAIMSYNQEQGTTMCAEGITQNTENNNCDIWFENEKKWNGLIGLLYASDYGYSLSSNYWNSTQLYDYATADANAIYPRTTSWMYLTTNHSKNEWLLSPSSIRNDGVLQWGNKGNIHYDLVYNIGTEDVRPVLHLVPDALATDAQGTESDPYVVVIE